MSKILSGLVLCAALLTPAAASAKRAPKTARPPAAEPADDTAATPSTHAVQASDDVPPAGAASPETASAPPPVATVAASPAEGAGTKRLGIGYKIGNGLGVVGADVVVNIVDHLSLDVQGNWISIDAGVDGTASGWGLAAEAQLFLKAGQVSSPYLGLGLAHAHMSLQDATGSATGAFANLGYEFRWLSGVGILLGGGIGYLGTVHASSATASIDAPGGAYLNLEVGLRYMFL